MPEPMRIEAMVRDCAAAGLRTTAPRRAILAALHDAPAPTDAVALMRQACGFDRSVRIGTVYRFLRDLERLHLIAAVSHAQGRLRWYWPGHHPRPPADDRPKAPATASRAFSRPDREQAFHTPESLPMTTHNHQMLRHPLVGRQLEVLRTDMLTPHMRRIVFGGPSLRGFLSAAPDDHVKLFFPNAAGAIVRPELGPNGAQFEPGVDYSPMRDYTPRHYDAQTNELTVDFVLHGDGPAATWAAQARPGQHLGAGGPRGSMVVADDFDTYLMAGDETALPAIGRWLEELPEGARAEVFVEIPDRGDRQALTSRAEFGLRWLERNGIEAADSQLLEQALEGWTPPPGETFYWIATESERARRIRMRLSERGVPKDCLKATGYWKARGHD